MASHVTSTVQLNPRMAMKPNLRYAPLISQTRCQISIVNHALPAALAFYPAWPGRRGLEFHSDYRSPWMPWFLESRGYGR